MTNDAFNPANLFALTEVELTDWLDGGNLYDVADAKVRAAVGADAYKRLEDTNATLLGAAVWHLCNRPLGTPAPGPHSHHVQPCIDAIMQAITPEPVTIDGHTLTLTPVARDHYHAHIDGKLRGEVLRQDAKCPTPGEWCTVIHGVGENFELGADCDLRGAAEDFLLVFTTEPSLFD